MKARDLRSLGWKSLGMLAGQVVGGLVVLGTARATTFIPMSIEDLTRSSIATVIGTVQEQHSIAARDGRIYTLVTIAVEQVLRGELDRATIILKEYGGRVGSRHEVEIGTPTFEAGQHVLLFLTVRPDGSLRTNHLALGKFALTIDHSGMPQARQRFGAGATVLLPPGVNLPQPAMPLGDILAAIANAGATVTASTIPLTTPPEASDASLPSAPSEPIVLEGPRFFEPDEGMQVPFLIDQNGDAILGLATSQRAIDEAFAAWGTAASSTVDLQDAGLTDDLTTLCPGPSKILFNDPDPTNPIPDPVNCHGTLAIGSYCASRFESKRFNGRSFERLLRGKVTFANGWDGCGVWNACNFAEIATHEIGHAIGLGHSSENFAEADPLLQDATMYYRAHFDGRCAGIRAYDTAAVSSLYPTAIPPTILTPDPLPPASSGVPYDQTLSATGGAGGYTWSLGRGGFDGLTLSAAGEISGTPGSGGLGFFQVTATDSNGDSHTKVLNISVAGATAIPTTTATQSPTPSGTHTASPLSTTTPTPSATPSPSTTPSRTDTPTSTPTDMPTSSPSPTATDTPTPTPSLTATASSRCAGDCDGSGEVSIDELLTLVNIALGSADPAACPAGDRDHDAVVTVDEILAAVNAALTGCGSRDVTPHAVVA